MLNSWAESHGLNKYRSITKDEEQSDGDGKCIFRQFPDTANMILNILWDRNEEMCTAELTEAVNEVYNRRWEKGLIQEFINLLIRMDYVEKKRHGFRVYYTALGSDYEL